VPAAASGFRTIQDCPKDLEALPVQPNLAVRGTAGSGGEPMLDLRRRQFITLMGGAAAAWPLAARAQRAKTNRIGWLVFGTSELGPIDQTLRDALAQRGFVQGRNIDVVFRYANVDPTRLPELARELAAQQPDLLMGLGGDVIGALVLASNGTPVVGGVSDNPVRAGIALTFARPGKVFTGVTFLTDEMAAKRMELLKEVATTAKRVAVVWNPQHLDDEMSFARRAAETLGIALTSHALSNSAETDETLRAARASGAEAIFVVPSRTTSIAAGKIAQFGREHRLPVIGAWREFVDAGCLVSYGPNRKFEAKRIAGYVEKIIAGEKPEDLPIETPTKFELVINLNTAKALGLEIPPTVLARADEVIE
jgi:putative tryptophan/tyrosine transport system substrate-binding protein